MQAMTDSPSQPDSARTLVFVLYGLYAAAFFTTGLTAVAGLVIAYLKRESLSGTVYRSHADWLIRTFWISLAVSLVGLLLTLLGIGMLLLMAVAVWVIYRLVVGALAVNERKPIAEGQWGLAA
jgi:uncharacterized membrane protein